MLKIEKSSRKIFWKLFFWTDSLLPPQGRSDGVPISIIDKGINRFSKGREPCNRGEGACKSLLDNARGGKRWWLAMLVLNDKTRMVYRSDSLHMGMQRSKNNSKGYRRLLHNSAQRETSPLLCFISTSCTPPGRLLWCAVPYRGQWKKRAQSSSSSSIP